MSVRVKICGVRTLEDAVHAMDAGADLLGFNLIPSSPRALAQSELKGLLAELRPRAEERGVELVLVVADLAKARLLELASLGAHALQLHGNEPRELVQELGPLAYKAVRIGGRADVELALGFPGERLLVDAKVPGQLGGTGVRIDWALLGELPAVRRLLLAGGLDPDNVVDAVRAVRPWAVDVASGVETSPGVKDPARVARFIERAKGA